MKSQPRVPPSLADWVGVQLVDPGLCPVEVDDIARHTSGRPFRGKVTSIDYEYKCVTMRRGNDQLTVCWHFVAKEDR